MKAKKIILFAIIIIANLYCYYPAFFDSCRGSDHQIYLKDVAGFETLGELLSHSYSYTRSLSTGDKILFRPLTYVVMAFERWLFGYDFFWWQITGFVLHLLAQWMMFKILNIFTSSRFSFLVILCSSLLFFPQEMVGRHHYSGYLLAQIFALCAVYHFFKYRLDPSQNKKRFWGFLACLTLASFGYESALILNGIFMIFLLLSGPPMFPRVPVRHKVAMVLPMGVYASVSVADFFIRVKDFAFSQGVTGLAPLESFKAGVFQANLVNLLKIGAQGLLFPALTKIKFVGDQYHYDSFSWEANNVFEVLNIGLALGGIVFLGLFLFFSLKNKTALRSYWDSKAFVMGLMLILYVTAYVGLLCPIRLQTMPGYLQTAPHHFYVIYVFSIVALYYLLLSALRFIEQSLPGLRRTLVVFFIVFALLQGYHLRKLNQDTRALWEPQRIYLKRMERFVKEHKHEPDFSFAVFKSELTYLYLMPVSAGPDEPTTLVDMFFPKYVKPQGPKYFVVYTKEQGVRSFMSGSEAKQYVQARIDREGEWESDFYISGVKIDLKQMAIMRSLQGRLQQKGMKP